MMVRLPRVIRHAPLAVALLLATSIAGAVPGLDVAHVQGRDTPWILGWNEAVVTLDNTRGAAFRGEVAIDASYGSVRSERPSVRVPVSVAAGEVVRVRLPVWLTPGTTPTVLLTAAGEGEVAQVPLGLTHLSEEIATIVEINPARPLGAKIVEVPSSAASPTPGVPGTAPSAGGDPFDGDEELKPHTIPPHGMGPKGGGATAPPPASVGIAPVPTVVSVQAARESSDPILADFAGGWSGAVLVMVPSDVLGRLGGRELDALVAWVEAGGSLAVAVVRDEDLRTPALEQLIGKDARATSGAGTERATFAGGRLVRDEESLDRGEVAQTGLGETWLLRHNPWASGVDAKSGKIVYDLWRKATARRLRLVAPPTGLGVRWYDDDSVRAVLDPSAESKPSLGVAALLVVLYALFVGPLAFGRARKLGKPLTVLRITPLLSLGLFVALIGLGKLGTGFRGRVRRLAMVDVAGGSTRGAAASLHAFYVGDPASIELAARRPIDGVHVLEPTADNAAVEIDRDGVAVRNVRAHPWQPVVIQEETAFDVPGGVVLEGSGGSLTLINKTPWALRHVILHPSYIGAPTRSHYFASVPPGGTVVARDGIAVDRSITPRSTGGASTAGEPWAAKDVARQKQSLDAIATLIDTSVGGSLRALPGDVPVATMLVELPSPSQKESGYKIERETLFLRVIGLGGDKGKGTIEPTEPLKERGKEKDL
jgi:hypothetical protein